MQFFEMTSNQNNIKAADEFRKVKAEAREFSRNFPAATGDESLRKVAASRFPTKQNYKDHRRVGIEAATKTNRTPMRKSTPLRLRQNSQTGCIKAFIKGLCSSVTE